MKTPKYTIIIPTYNRVDLVKRAIESVFSQEYSNWQLIIVDDGSTDPTAQYLKTITDKRVQSYYQPNKGETSARNLGMKHIKGEWVCYLDSDDIIKPNYLSTFESLMDGNHNIYCAGMSLLWIDNGKEKIIVPPTDKVRLLDKFLAGYFNLMPFCMHVDVARSRSFEAGVVYGGDFQYILPLLLYNDIKVSTNITSSIIEHSGRIVRNIYNNPYKGLAQLQHSVLDSIEKEKPKLLEYFTEDHINNIIKAKIKNYIISVADQNLFTAMKMMSYMEEKSPILLPTLMTQRLKGIVKSILYP